MNVAPTNPVLQALSGAQETGVTRHHATAAHTETARAIGATEKSEQSRTTNLRQRREPEDDDHTRPKPRGSLVDIVT